LIEHVTGDILRADVEALVNTVNCVGIMGRGIALQFKNAYPANFKAYQAACRLHEVQPGRMFVFETEEITGVKFIINFPTKRHWKGKSRIEDIDSGLVALASDIRARGIRSIAVPPLGSGLGGLDWNTVRPRIEQSLGAIPNLRLVIFQPNDTPATVKSRSVPAMTPGRAALVVLMNRYLGGLMDPFVTLIELQKLMYFMQEAGTPLRLKYSKHHYGPYADNLRHVLNAIEGHLVSGYHDGGDTPDKQLELVPSAVADAQAFLAGDEQTRLRFDRVADLVDGYETPFGLELLATVHWVATQEGAADAGTAVTRVHAWNDRKKRFNPDQITLAYETLRAKSWLPSMSSAANSIAG
jgi:O-acetyl-ADP-ribose deacetylase (regulator of RNase III)